MSSIYHQSIQEDFDDDGADAMEYEPSEKSIDQKSLLDEIPEPYQYDITNETLDPSHPALPITSHFGYPNTVPPGGHYYNQSHDGSQNISSSFLNLSDSISQKEGGSKFAHERSIESAANNESHIKISHDNSQELKQQIVELKRILSIKEQDLMYTKQRNEKLTNQLNGFKGQGDMGGSSLQARQLAQENQLLRDKFEEATNEISRMKEYIDEVLKDADQAQLVLELQAEKEENSKLKDEKNQLLNYVEETIIDQERTADLIKSLKEENDKLKEELADTLRSQNGSKADMDRHEYENRHNFDTFGGEGDESILKLQLKNANEEIKKLRDDIEKLKETRTIESKSKETDIKNLKQKLEIAEKGKENSDKCIEEMESHYKNEIESTKLAYEETLEKLKQSGNTINELRSKIETKQNELELLNTKHNKLKDNYNALDETWRETQSELDELKEKFNKEIDDGSFKQKYNDVRAQNQQMEKEISTLITLKTQQENIIESKSGKISDLTEQIHSFNSKILELQNNVDKLSRENSTLHK